MYSSIKSCGITDNENCAFLNLNIMWHYSNVNSLNVLLLTKIFLSDNFILRSY